MSEEYKRQMIDRIRATGDMKERTVIAGLTREPFESDGREQSCENCFYFLAYSRRCDLPELNVPVDPDWHCKLWRVLPAMFSCLRVVGPRVPAAAREETR